LKLPNVEFAIERVAVRVKQGGHFVPVETIRRRFLSGHAYRLIVDAWAVYDNSGEVPKLIEEGANK
jgi:predicted ABC-type ATPase